MLQKRSLGRKWYRYRIIASVFHAWLLLDCENASYFVSRTNHTPLSAFFPSQDNGGSASTLSAKGETSTGQHVGLHDRMDVEVEATRRSGSHPFGVRRVCVFLKP